MTGLENFHRMLSGGKPERLPFDVSATAPFLDKVEERFGTRDAVEALGGDFRTIGVGFPDHSSRWREAYRSMGVQLGESVVVSSFGVAHAVPPRDTLGSAYHLLEMIHPLEDVERVTELESLPWPDIEDPNLYADLPDRVDRIHAEGRAVVGALACTVFESTWYVRGMDRVFLDLIDGSPVTPWLFDWNASRSAYQAAQYARAGVDVLQLGDDVGSQRGMLLSVEMWREHLKPRLASVIRAAKEANPEIAIFYHSDGDVRPIVSELAEIGVEILNPIQPECMPIDEVLGAFGDRMAFWGMIGTQTTMPFGSAADVRDAVTQIRDWAGKGVRVVVAPTHVLEPDVPMENALALAESVKLPL